MILHAGCVAARRGKRWAGVLVTGASGSGKSDLMLRLIDRGWRLVADDRVFVWACEGGLYARAPAPLAGLVEVRGFEIVALPQRAFARIVLAAACLGRGERPDRLREDARQTVAGVEVARLDLRPLEASAPLKVALALDHASRGRGF